MTITNGSIEVDKLDAKRFRSKTVLISAYLSAQDIDAGFQGDSPTLKSLKEAIEQHGGNVIYVPYTEFGVTGYSIKLMERLKRKSISNQISGSHTRWMYTAIFHFLNYTFSVLDPLFKHRAKMLKNLNLDACIFFYPYLFPTLKRVFKGPESPEMILFEVNIETKFFQFQFSMSRFKLIKNFLVKLISMMESKSILLSDSVLTVASRDAKELSSLFSSKQVHVFPFQDKRDAIQKKRKEHVRVKDVLRKTYSELGPEIVKVTFMGSNYSLNVRSVQEVIRLAEKMKDWRDKIRFVIVGNVLRSFIGECELPENVIFTGHLNDFSDVMSASDFFIMFDYMGTGVESKCRVYSEYPGLTLALTTQSEEYLPILKDKLIPFDTVDSIEKFLMEFSDCKDCKLNVPDQSPPLIRIQDANRLKLV